MSQKYNKIGNNKIIGKIGKLMNKNRVCKKLTEKIT